MLSRAALGVKCCRLAAVQAGRRNIGVTAACQVKAAAATDPIQKLFLDKIQEYAKKSQSVGGGLVDATPETQKNLENELAKVDRQYGAHKEDLTAFPTFNFSEPTLEEPLLEKTPPDIPYEEEKLQEIPWEDKPYWDQHPYGYFI